MVRSVGGCGTDFRRSSTWSRNAAFFIIGAFASAAALAQTPAASPSVPLYLDGTVSATATAPDGSTIIGGSFSFIDGQPRANIARLRPDGTLDPDWNPGADWWVNYIAIDAAGSVYASGCFSRIGGAARRGFAKLAATGTGLADPDWNPNSDQTCGGPMLLDATGTSLFVGGTFQQIGGFARNQLAKLDAAGSGATDPTWNPAPDTQPYFATPISAMARDASGSIYVAGIFTHIGGQAVAQLAKLSANGTGSADANWNPAPDCYVYSLVLDPAGPLYAGGCFSTIGGQTAHHLAKLSTTAAGAAQAAWKPDPDNDVTALVLAGNELYLGGSFNHVGNIAATSIARVSTSGNGKPDASWTPAVVSNNGATINALAFNGPNIAVAGVFDTVSGQDRTGLALIDASANVLPARDALLPGFVDALLAQPGGGTIVGGAFHRAGTTVRNNLLRLQADGSLDAVWNPDADKEVTLLVLGDDGTVYASGYFSRIGGNGSAGIARISGTGAGVVDPLWQPSIAPYVVLSALAVDAAGNAYAATNVEQPRLVKITSAGSVDAAWSPNPDSNVSALIVDDASGKLYAGGWFQNIGGASAPYLARLDLGTGAADPSWLPQLTFPVQSLRPGPGDDLYIGGYFGDAAGTQANGLARVSRSSATLDANWLPRCQALAFALDASRNVLYASACFTNIGRALLTGPGVDTQGWGAQLDANGNPHAIAIDALSGNVLIGGAFLSVNGVPRVGLAALPPNAPPLPAGERAWLAGFYTAMNGSQWYGNAGWNGDPGSECGWYGVQCLNGHVFGLELSLNGLSGEIPDFSGLDEINEINLAANALTGSIPPLDALSELRVFNVFNNQLTGSIPPLAALSQLQYFSVDENQLTGTIPEIDTLGNLHGFSASENALTGEIPLPGAAMYLFNVASNALGGPIPPLSNALYLNTFNVSHNQLTGAIPDLSGNAYLLEFNASYNQLSGPVPPGHPEIMQLILGNNSLSGSIPSLENFPSLYNLDLDHNQLTGSIPAMTSTIWDFDVGSNQLGGTLPQLSELPNLYHFSVSHNQLTGSIPALPAELTSFDASWNLLSGEIQLSGASLYSFDVSHNALVGSIPALGSLPQLSVFAASNNLLTGTLPQLQTTNLAAFEAAANQLTGTIPPLPASMLALVVNSNALTGNLPDLGNAPYLSELDVSDNQLGGTIAPFLASSSLQRFAVAGNQLTGAIPSLAPLQYVFSIDVSRNHLTGAIPDLDVPFLQDFIADSNELTGPLPTIGFYLQYFSVRDNQLEGTLPFPYYQPRLQFFDVTSNRLTGFIPDLSALTGLQYYRVGSNRLTGAVPTAPASLVANGSSLCANLLDTAPSANDDAWDVATGTAPSAWWMTPFANNRCDDVFTNGF